MKGTQSLERALDILFVLGEAGETLSVPDIAKKVRIPESTAYRFLQTLERNGIIERKAQGQIGLGLRILDLAKSLSNQMDQKLSDIARPYMKQLMEDTKETVVLYVRTGMNVIAIQSIAGAYLVRLVVEDGKTFPIRSGASGKAILAFENDRIINQVFNTLDRVEEKQQLSDELVTIQEKGYSLTDSEVDEGIIGIAAPIFDHKGNVAGSLTVAGPTERMAADTDDFIKKTTDAAKKITNQLELISDVTIG